MSKQEGTGVRLAPLPKGYIRLISKDTASSPGSITRILPDGSEEYVTAVPKNAIVHLEDNI